MFETSFSIFIARSSFSPCALPPTLGTVLISGFVFGGFTAFGGPFNFFRGGGRAGVHSKKFSFNIFQNGEEDAAHVDDVTKQVRRHMVSFVDGFLVALTTLASVVLGSGLVLGFSGRWSFFYDFRPFLAGLALPFAVSFAAFPCVLFV